LRRNHHNAIAYGARPPQFGKGEATPKGVNLSPDGVFCRLLGGDLRLISIVKNHLFHVRFLLSAIGVHDIVAASGGRYPVGANLRRGHEMPLIVVCVRQGCLGYGPMQGDQADLRRTKKPYRNA
jgi:hypothetical protein